MIYYNNMSIIINILAGFVPAILLFFFVCFLWIAASSKKVETDNFGQCSYGFYGIEDLKGSPSAIFVDVSIAFFVLLFCSFIVVVQSLSHEQLFVTKILSKQMNSK